ncbi:hypothetical protein CAAN1_13S01354 [[Candida] anglica]|uniref:Zn(2)-C6 fungal-type domain-containing protein n=1 Tax=[Candida] anglica TaxID=148631 RepID=A0ABP0EJK9_9ASCO
MEAGDTRRFLSISNILSEEGPSSNEGPTRNSGPYPIIASTSQPTEEIHPTIHEGEVLSKVDTEGKKKFKSHKGLLTKFRVKQHQQQQAPESQVRHDNSRSRCRKLKKKCDRGDPACYNCLKSKYTCVYMPRKIRAKSERPSLSSSSSSSASLSSSSSSSMNLGNGLYKHRVNSISSDDSSNNPFTTKNKESSVAIMSCFQFEPSESSHYPRSFIPSVLEKSLDEFFSQGGRFVPFLSKAEVKQTLKFNALNSYQDQFTLYMMFLIGYTHLQRTGALPNDQSCDYFLTKAFSHCNDFSEISVQNVKRSLLLLLYANLLPSGTPWEILGKTIQACFSLRLNTNCSKEGEDGEIITFECQDRNRVFWSVYVLDGFMALSLGQPPWIGDEYVNIVSPPAGSDQAEWSDFVEARYLCGEILRKVHSVGASRRYINNEPAKLSLLNGIHNEVEAWHHNSLVKFHFPAFEEYWENKAKGIEKMSHTKLMEYMRFESRYFVLKMLLNKPSFLYPNPLPEKKLLIGSPTLNTIKSIQVLYDGNEYHFNLINMNIFLTICGSIVYCLQENCINIEDLKSEIVTCITVLESFGRFSLVAKKAADLFISLQKQIEVSPIFQPNDPNIVSYFKIIKEWNPNICSIHHTLVATSMANN